MQFYLQLVKLDRLLITGWVQSTSLNESKYFLDLKEETEKKPACWIKKKLW